MLELLAKAATWGGNLLINVSPRPDGSLPDDIYTKMGEGAAWMKTHGSAVFDAEPGPYPEQCNLPVTVAAGRWYIFVPPMFTGPVILKNVPKPVSAALMGSNRPVPVAFADAAASLTLSADQRNQLMDVITVQWA
jgi:alpha-L-fucosidase